MIKKMKKEQLLMMVLAVILVIVIAIPVDKQEKETLTEGMEAVKEEAEISMELQLKEVLQKIAGVGKVEVFMTYEDKGKLVVEKDQSVSEELIQESDSSGGNRTTTTTRNESETIYDKTESPYVVQEISPAVKGVLVVAEGAGNLQVKEKIETTIQALFGLDSHKISIMKMEVTK